MEVSKEDQNLVFDIRITSNVPGKITGENKISELKGIDLAMKLHYLKGLYFFANNNSSITSEEENNNNNNSNNCTSFVNNQEFRHKAAFDWLVSYFMVCGRIRVDETETNGRPAIKMNDAGIRFVEARSSKTVDEWLAMDGFLSIQDQLIYNHGLGPHLPFSPLVCIQVTWFKCGGISVGLNWAHVLGDAFSASEFMNLFGLYLEGHYQQPIKLVLEDPPLPKYHPSNPTQEPISVKRVNPVGNHWFVPTNCKIGTHSFNLTSKQLDQLHLRVHGPKNDGTTQCFEVITSIIWKSIAQIRKDLDTQSVTICKPKTTKRKQVVPYNGQVLGIVKANFKVSSVDPKDLVYLVTKKVVDETNVVEDLVNNESSKFDFIAYGANNITFVDMEEVDLYGFILKGNYPKFASYTIGGVGDKGVVLVLPGPKHDGINGDNGNKFIVLLLPEDEIVPLKIELQKEWCIA